mmetsp:Transcript_4689/g.8957  ORF Transcript_4689/g.8957 Transcript_4689/m.8957 type:complete len:302 (+) Transcript_4689:104-1009(+)
MSHRHKTSFIHGRSKVDAPLKHHSVPLGELFGVGSLGVREVLDGSLGEEPSEHTTGNTSCDVVSVLLGSGRDAVDQFLRLALEFFVNTRFAELLQGFDTGTHGQGVTRKSTGLVHGTGGCNIQHNILTSTVGADGHTTTDDLTHSGNIRGDAKVLLGTTEGDTESSHDFVKDQKGTVILGHLSESLQECLVGLDESGVTYDGFEDDGGDFVLVFLENRFNGFQIVVLSTESTLSGRLGYTGGIGETQSGDTRSSLDQEGISVTVVASLELDDLLTSGVSTNKTKHTHASFRTRVGETNHLY